MEKEKYEKAEMEVIVFETEDVITESVITESGSFVEGDIDPLFGN